MTFSVVQRRATIGMLRALGVTRPEIVAAVLVEALLIGLVATSLGLVLGVALAGGLLRLVTRTINDLYFVVVVRDLALSPAVLAKGAALGLGATLCAAIVPAAEASGAPPGAAISGSRWRRARGARRRGPRWPAWRSSWPADSSSAPPAGASPGATRGSSPSSWARPSSRRSPWSGWPGRRDPGSAGSSVCRAAWRRAASSRRSRAPGWRSRRSWWRSPRRWASA